MNTDWIASLMVGIFTGGFVLGVVVMGLLHDYLHKQQPGTAKPIPTSCACQRCGRKDGLDAAVTDELWEQLTGRTDGGGLLCLWCMDALAAERGLTGYVMLAFAGRALSGAEGPMIWDEDVLTEQLLEANDRCVKAVAEQDAAWDGGYKDGKQDGYRDGWEKGRHEGYEEGKRDR